MSKNVLTFEKEAHKKILSGVDYISKMVGMTLGPAGKTVMIHAGMGKPKATKDGYTVAQSIELADPIEDIGSQTVKEVAIRSNEQAGDGTTTATVLANALTHYTFDAIKNEQVQNVNRFRKGMQDELEAVIEFLTNEATTFDVIKDGELTDEARTQLRKIAMISSNSDQEITDVLMEAFEIVKDYGAIKIDIGKSHNSYVQEVDGMTYANGMVSGYLSNQENRIEWRGENALIFITNYRISHLEEIQGAVQYAHENKRQLLIICEDIDEMALRYVLTNKMSGNLDACVVKNPGFGSQVVENLLDIATVTGGKTILKDTSINLRGMSTKDPLSYLGVAGTVVVRQHEFSLVNGGGDQKKIESHIEGVKERYESEVDPYMKSKQNERLARMMTGVAMIYVGGDSELEAKEKRDRMEDAMNAVRAAADMGYILGGGLPLLKYSYLNRKTIEEFEKMTDYEKGRSVLAACVKEPFCQILENAYFEPVQIDAFAEMSKDFTRSFDLFSKTTQFIDYEEAGIIDPVKVTISALKNAVGICSTLITIGGTITIKSEETPSQPFQL